MILEYFFMLKIIRPTTLHKPNNLFITISKELKELEHFKK